MKGLIWASKDIKLDAKSEISDGDKMGTEPELSLVAVVYVKRDLKKAPYNKRIAQILEDIAYWLGNATYEGDLYLGEVAPKYKQRNRRYKLPKNIQQFKDEVANGKLWNLALYDRNDFSGSALYCKMQPDAVLNQPASIYISVPWDRAKSDGNIISDFWAQFYEAVDEAGWGFVDITDHQKDYLFKLDGILYGHFPDAWKREIDVWKKNRKQIKEGILNVYWKNLWSSVHVRKIGGLDRLRELLEGGGFDFDPLPSGGARIDLRLSVDRYASADFQEKRQRLREIAHTLIWRGP